MKTKEINKTDLSKVIRENQNILKTLVRELEIIDETLAYEYESKIVKIAKKLKNARSKQTALNN